jgi:hypothetical protein
MAFARYHVVIDRIRTTVTLAPVLSELLALKLGAQPQTPQAGAAVRAWLQQEIDQDPGAVRHGHASQRLAHQAILHIAAPALVNRRDLWMERRYR